MIMEREYMEYASARLISYEGGCHRSGNKCYYGRTFTDVEYMGESYTYLCIHVFVSVWDDEPEFVGVNVKAVNTKTNTAKNWWSDPAGKGFMSFYSNGMGESPLSTRDEETLPLSDIPDELHEHVLDLARTVAEDVYISSCRGTGETSDEIYAIMAKYL